MSMNLGRKILLASAGAGALLVAGCATETAYRPATGQGFSREGFSEHRIEPNRWDVTFAGNSYTSRETVEKYLLFRAAQLTVQQGFDYFVMANRDTDKSTRVYTTPGFPSYGPWGGYWGPRWRYFGGGFGWRSWDPYFGDPFWDRSVDINTVQKYEASAEIVMGRGAKPANNLRAFDARAVMDSIGPSVVLPK